MRVEAEFLASLKPSEQNKLQSVVEGRVPRRVLKSTSPERLGILSRITGHVGDSIKRSERTIYDGQIEVRGLTQDEAAKESVALLIQSISAAVLQDQAYDNANLKKITNPKKRNKVASDFGDRKKLRRIKRYKTYIK